MTFHHLTGYTDATFRAPHRNLIVAEGLARKY